MNEWINKQMNEYTGRQTDGQTADGRTNEKLLNIGFENLNWQEADQLAI